MKKIRRQFTAAALPDPAATVRRELEASGLPFKKGQSIAIAVGSRGIRSIDSIILVVVEYLTAAGVHPFIIPAMGSHGEATPEGQRAILAGYGITEERMGIPVDASMEVIELDTLPEGVTVVMSRAAYTADGVIVINRIKPHTDYHGNYESGLAKMCVIGLGKHAQAREMHRFGARGLKEYIPAAASRILATGKIVAGIAIVENAVDKPYHIELIPGDRIMEREPDLLKMAYDNMPRLPVEELDLLIVDYIGKDFSGTGLDTNIIGRMRIRGEPEPLQPRIKSIMVRDVSDRSHGNALGIGLAEVITRRLFNKINFTAMYENAFTSTFVERVKIPVIAEDDAQGIAFALRSCGGIPRGMERVLRIRNTLQIDEMYVSEPLCRELEHRSDIAVLSEPVPLLTGSGISRF